MGERERERDRERGKEIRRTLASIPGSHFC